MAANLCPARGSRPDIDLGLAVISAVSTPGLRWTQAAIAEVCNCTPQAIQQIERRALKKLRKRLGCLIQTSPEYRDLLGPAR